MFEGIIKIEKLLDNYKSYLIEQFQKFKKDEWSDIHARELACSELIEKIIKDFGSAIVITFITKDNKKIYFAERNFNRGLCDCCREDKELFEYLFDEDTDILIIK